MKQDKLKVSEIFLSIQGEGLEQGKPTIFVRLMGCNLNCHYCDTKYAQNGNNYTEMTIKEICKKVDNYLPYDNIQITGGEPLIHPHIEKLIDALLMKKKTIWINTNGSRDISKYVSKGNRCRLMMDIKGPSSGMTNKMYWKNLDYLRDLDQLIFVIGTRKDYWFAKKQALVIARSIPVQINFSPCFAVRKNERMELSPADIVEKIKKDKLSVRLSLQLHKIIWDSKKREV